MPDLKGKRILVVGASSGIGRQVAKMAVADGAQVAFSARRLDRLEEAVADAGSGVAIRCDVRDPADCAALVAETVRNFGGIDGIVYATAAIPFVRISEADADLWNDTLATNVVGASLVIAAALPHLKESFGRVVLISATSVGRPVPGLGLYACTKAALEELVRVWRATHRDVTFVSARVGSTLGTEVGVGADLGVRQEMGEYYQKGGFNLDNGPGTMTVEDCSAAVLMALTVPVCIREFSATAAASAETFATTL
jgi:NAD(P)-dependent dehydrogenase (short-subunit alcohol dehydrogenase family)